MFQYVFFVFRFNFPPIPQLILLRMMKMSRLSAQTCDVMNPILTSNCAQNILNEVTGVSWSTTRNSKLKPSKRSVSTLTYCLCMSLLLIGGNIESNPGPSHNGHEFEFSSVEGLRIRHLNDRSLVNKMDEMIHKRREVYIESYSLVRRDKARHKGGVLIYIDKTLNFIELKELQHIDIESLWVKVKPNKSKGFVMCSCYTGLQIWNMIKSFLMHSRIF